MTPTPRREFLALAGALTLARLSPASSAPMQLTPPPPPAVMPKAWLSAPTLPLWPVAPPGVAGFAPQPLPPNNSPAFVRNVARPELRVFRPVHPNGHSVIVVPGGSYEFVSIANEGLDPARKLAESGSTVFVLTYRLPGEGWANRSAVPLQDAQRAMRIVRSHASQLAIDPDKVGILGFSAGGHLAATLATQHFEHTYDPIDAIDELDARPHTAGLIYPVVTMQTPWTHEISRRRLLGDSPSPTEIARRSAEQQVGPATVPVFLVHAFDDRAVPIENSLRLMEAMRTAQRPIEAHLLQEGGHAFGTGYPGSPSAHWCSLYSSWVSRVT